MLRRGGGPTVCRLTTDGTVEVWTDDDEPAHRRPSDVVSMHPHPSGCVVLAPGGTLELLGVDGTVQVIGERVVAVDAVGHSVILATADEVVRWHADGVTDRISGASASAVGRCGERWCWGDASGRIVLDGGVELRETPSSAVTALTTGPGGVVLAGYDDGTVGAWDPGGGSALLRVHLHGPVQHLAVEDDRVLAATAVGDLRHLDLGVLAQDRCALLRDVWRRGRHGAWRAGPGGARALRPVRRRPGAPARTATVTSGALQPPASARCGRPGVAESRPAPGLIRRKCRWHGHCRPPEPP